MTVGPASAAAPEAETILIVGGGIGGLTAALALLRQGKRVSVFESAPAIGDVGAGISLGPTASRGLYSLGLEQALREKGDRPGDTLTTTRQVSAALHYQTGEVLGGAFKDRQWKPEDLGPTHVIHRADLFTILQDAVLALAPDALHLGHEFESFAQDADGVTVRFADGRTAHGSTLIGCDGIRSSVRTQMFGPENPRFTGQIAYRFLVPIEQALPFLGSGPVGPYVGPGKSMMWYPIRHKTLLNCVAFVSADTWTGEGWSQTCSTEELQSLFTGWHANVQGLAAAAPSQGTAKWALYDRDPLDCWVQDRVALLGDAAHPMLPFLGLGAAMAIEDAVVLGRLFAQVPDPQAALALYEHARLERANLILLESRRQAQTFREGPEGQKSHTVTTHKDRMNYDPSAVVLAVEMESRP